MRGIDALPCPSSDRQAVGGAATPAGASPSQPSHCSPFDQTSFFQMGTICFRRLIAYWHASKAGPRCGVATVVTALFFGWYHIGNEQLFAAVLPPFVALRTVLIILPVGLAFGWLYIRRGLEAAILSHFVIDVIVHVVRPLVEQALG